MLDIQGRKYAPTTVCDVTLYDLNSKYPVMYFDTLKLTNIEGAAEVTDIQGGKGNSILASISHSKTTNVQFDDAIMSMASLAVLTGGQLRQGTDTDKIIFVETELVSLDGDDTSVVLSKNARKDSTVWIGKVINGVIGTTTRTKVALVTESATIALTDFQNFDITETAGTYRVFYETEKGFPTSSEEVEELTIWADKFAGTYRFVGDTVLYNQYSGTNDIFQIEIPKLMLDSSYSLNLNAATEAVVFSFKGKALRDEAGRIMFYRKLSELGSISATDSDVQLDGSYANIPADGVVVDSITGAITETGYTKPVKPDASF